MGTNVVNKNFDFPLLSQAQKQTDTPISHKYTNMMGLLELANNNKGIRLDNATRKKLIKEKEEEGKARLQREQEWRDRHNITKIKY